MKTIKIAVIAMMGMSLGVNAQDETVNGKLTVNGNIDSGEYLNLVNKGVRHSIFNYSGNSNFYFGAGKDNEGNKKEIIFYNYSCNGGCNVPKIQLLTDILYTSGKTGIGTGTPETKLHVKGNSQIEHSNGRSIRFDGYEGITTYGPSHWLHLNRYSNDNVAIGHNSIANVFMVKGGGNVGIGTISPTAKLSVNGKIHTKEVRVDLNLSDWADFVFEEDYNLPTLKEVENHIKEKRHLIDIPSAKEVEKNGIYLGEMDSKLLQKIEELTLYTIAQEKEIKELKKEKAENKKQQKEIDELKALVQQLLKDKN